MFKLRKLPFTQEDIAQFLSVKTFEYHYGKHHQAYINNLNNLLPSSGFENSDLLEIILKSSGGIFNNAAQVFNHDFFWDCMTPCSTQIGNEFQEAIVKDFGSLEKLKEEFAAKALSLFGSGWCWLVLNQEQLEIHQTSNAQVPMTEGKIPLLVVDVWEHAYYIDYKNARANYLDKFWSFINWEFVSNMFMGAKAMGMESIREYTKSIHS